MSDDRKDDRNDDRDDRPRDERKDDDAYPPWIDRVVSVAGALGANRVRLRWKLIRWASARRAAGRRRAQAVAHVRYEHAVCPECGAVHARDEATCTRCGAAMRSRPREVLGRLGLGALESTTAWIGLTIVTCYAATAIAGHNAISIPIQVLIARGGNLPAGALVDEPWRYVTSTLLHAGLWHIAFNLYALSVVGPVIEREYGRLGGPLVFLVTGALASFASQQTGLEGVGIGASGAIMGMMGAIVAMGFRRGTTVVSSERSQMLRWAAYTVIFGFGIGADNRAHVAGFLAGGALGFVVPGRVRAHRAARVAIAAGGAAAMAAIVGAAVLVMVPPETTAIGGLVRDESAGIAFDYELCQTGRTHPQITDSDSEPVIDAMCARVDVMERWCAGPVPAFLDSQIAQTECWQLREMERASTPDRAIDPSD